MFFACSTNFLHFCVHLGFVFEAQYKSMLHFLGGPGRGCKPFYGQPVAVKKDIL